MQVPKSFTPIDPSNKRTDHTTSRPDTSLTIRWTLESKPLAVQLSTNALFNIRATVTSSRDAQPRLCPGGLLLGTCDHSQSWKVEISDHVPLEWDLSRGGAPLLTEEQSRALQDKVASYSGDVSVVGFYRGSRAADRGEDHSSDSLMGTRRSIAEADRSLLLLCSRLGSPSVRLQLDGPGLDLHGIVLWEDANVYELVPSMAQVSAPRMPTTSEAVSLFNEKRSDLRSPLIPEQKQSNQASTLPPKTTGPSEHRIFSHPILWFLGTILVSVLTYVGAHFFVKPLVMKVAGRIQADEVSGRPETAPSRVGLGLQANQSGGTVELSWDPASLPVKMARSGRLVITDGTLTRELTLSRNQLQADKIFYSPQDGDVTFRLEVVDSESHAIGESVRVLRGASLPNALSSAGPVLNQQGSAASDLSGARTLSRLSAPSAVVPGKTALRTSTTSPQMRPETSIVIVPSAPVQQPSPAPAAVEHPFIATVPEEKAVRRQEPLPIAASEPLFIPPARSPWMLSLPPQNTADLHAQHETHQPASSTAASRPATVAVNRSLTSPQVLVGPTPDISQSMHPFLHKDLSVPVAVKIDESGKVTSATLAPVADNVPSYFANQALNAARRWRFSPAKLDGRPIGSELVIRFHFRAMS